MRVELGPRDIENKQCVIKMRDTGEKQTLDMVGAGAKIKDNLEIMHHRMLKKYVHPFGMAIVIHVYI